MRPIAVHIIFQRFNVPCKPFPVILDGEGLFVFNGLRFRIAAGRSWVFGDVGPHVDCGPLQRL